MTTTSAEAQDIPDVPALEWEIAPSEGVVGSIVEGTVDPEEISEYCITDPVEFVSQFVNPASPIIPVPTPYQAVNQIWMDDPDNDFSLNPVDSPTRVAGAVAMMFPVGVALDLPPAGDGSLAEDAVSQTLIMAFADLETADPIAPFGNFDPISGEGSVVVPDLAPGLHPVVATCVGLPDEISTEMFYSAMDVTIEFVEENVEPPYPESAQSDEFLELAAEVAPVLLQELVEPRALGVDFYCILDDDGYCAVPPEPIGLIDDEVINGVNGDPVVEPSDVAAPSPAPTAATPSFTG